MIIIIEYYDYEKEEFGRVIYREIDYKEALELFHDQYPTCEIDAIAMA